MIAALARTLAARTPRERVLLAALGIVALPLALWLLVAAPLVAQRAQARAALDQAQATRAWFLDRQAEIAALPVAGASAGAVPAPVGLGGIEARLIDAGLRDTVVALANVTGGSVTLTLTALPFGDLMDWLDAIEAEAGYRLSALQVTRGDGDGLVDADLRLDPRGGQP